MATDILWRRAPDLTGYKDIVLSRDVTNRCFVNLLAYDRLRGFTGGLLLNKSVDADLAEIVAGLDRHPGDFSAGCKAGGSWAVEEHLSKSTFIQALSRLDLGPRENREMVAENLSPGAIEFLRSIGAASRTSRIVSLASFLAGGDSAARLQALTHYTPLSLEIIESEELTAAIDARREFLPALATALSIDMPLARKASVICGKLSEAVLCGSPLASFVMNPHRPLLPNILQMAEMIATADLPESPDGTARGIRELRAASTQAKSLDLGLAPFAREFRKLRAADWADFELPQATPGDRDYLSFISEATVSAAMVGAIRDDLPGVMERLEEISLRILDDAEVRPQERNLMVAFLSVSDRRPDAARVPRAIGRHVSLKTLRELSRRWHHQTDEISSRLTDVRSHLEWTPLLGLLPAAEKGITLREICSNTGLKDLGKAEEHCVGSYASTVMNARNDQASLIFTVEREAEILSTLELRVELSIRRSNRALSASVVQNMARRNSAPCAEALAAGDHLARAVAKLPPERFEGYVRGIAATAGLKADLVRVITTSSANLLSASLPETVIATLDPVLPKPLRGGALLACVEFRPAEREAFLWPIGKAWAKLLAAEARLEEADPDRNPEYEPAP